VLGHICTEHIEMRQHVPPIHPFSTQVPIAPPGKQFLD
jgi:hypothetical protein